jgi:hypothetical protein
MDGSLMAVTPNYSWPVPVNTDYVKDGADAIKDLGDAIDATVFGLPSGSGLTLVSATTIGSAVSSVTVSGAFSATYDNYKIMISGGSASGSSPLRLKIGSATTNYYQIGLLSLYSSASPLAFADSNALAFFRFVGDCSTNNIVMNLELSSPFLAKNTYFSNVTPIAATGSAVYFVGGYLNDTTSYSDFTITNETGVNFTGGTIRVYGYQN